MTVTKGRSRRGPAILLALVAVVALVAAGGLWYLFFRPSGPAPVSLGSAAPTQAAPASVAAVDPTAAAPSGAPASDPASGDPASPAATGGAPAGDGISGTWSVDPSVGSFSDFSGSFVGYRVKETLANVGATTAVGRTPGVTGSITVDGTTVTAASFTADLTALQSDEQFRDGQLRRQALETSTFPTATFTLTSPIDLGAVPAEGATVSATAKGDLTLHGVTKAVELPLQARLQGGVVTVAGSLPIVFADYGIQKPQSMMVLSVEDNGIMELQLQLTRG